MDNLELYQEEQRELLLDLNKGIQGLSSKLQEQIDSYEVVKNVEVTGQVQVNTEKTVEVSNLESLQDAVKSLEDTLHRAITDNSYKPLESVTVKNIKDALPTELKITNLSDIKQYFVNLDQTIKNNQPIVNVQKQEVSFPTDPKKPVAVRLSDGKKFYDALTAAVGGGIDSQGIINAINNISTTTTTNYKTEVDKSTTTNVIYIGKAPIGTATSTAGWQIKKIDKTVTDNVTITFAAAGAFTATWNNRGSETYS